ncbi:MAG TPA: 3,4-dihydroxy-2-butanone-4-phosphate synthase [Rhodospirillaceae bacterium]|jgi:6,7-dimethyl-8-ribityllumazine synthase|nr:3,4-dihydroxy-2-butanone-4-phosphate synthase [Alphaproteobacteria bacterium]HBH26067.1 3,4-dihydroxy-2-butanone-4-phosphate synthase [Rhodospirillaceae bacterium]
MDSIEDILADFAAGRPVVVTDDAGREDEGDLVIAAQHATHEAIAFMAIHGRGLICLALTEADADRLELPLAPRRGPSRHGTAFTASIEARDGVTTGISAVDRARTIAVAVDPASGPGDIATPGHVFPLRAAQGGVLQRPGHTEAAVDLARLAGLPPAGVVCEIMNDDGTMARGADLAAFAARHGLKVTSVAAIAAHRKTLGEEVPHPVTIHSPRHRIAITRATFYPDLADALLAGARGVFADCTMTVFDLPGALELAPAIALLAPHHDAFVALGCVIRGETSHYDIVCRESARGLTALALSGLPLGNGVLTCENRAQAEARAETAGARAAEAALALLALKAQLKV